MAEATLVPTGVAARAWPAAAWALCALLIGLGLLRAGTIVLSGAGLHVDEAQYWDWSRELHWGYYSKPPGIAALIAVSTALFGEGLLGVRALCMACWLLASAVLWRAGAAIDSERAGRWAALCLAATSASGLLGMTATTDAPLMLCSALVMFATWGAVQSERPARWWCLAGLAFGSGLLSKYTMAAAVVSLAWLAWRTRRRREVAGVAATLAIGALFVSPNLWWNAAHDWPTLRHTAEITVGAAPQRGTISLLASLGDYVGGQLLLVGPALVVLLVALWRRAPVRGKPGGAVDGESFALAFALPLLAVGLLQALHARTQMNWTAPALLGISLWAGLRAARSDAPLRWLVLVTAVSAASTTALALAGDIRRLLPSERAAVRSWDLWARMRGWQPALDALRPALVVHPDLPLRADSRELSAHAAYAWRDLPRRVEAVPFDGLPRHHYEMLADRTSASRGPWLLLTANEPAPTLLRGHGPARLLAEARDGRVVVRLWWLHGKPVPPASP